MWESFITNQQEEPYFLQLQKRLEQELESETVYPPQKLWLKAFEMTPFDSLKVVIVGQDPYHGHHQANGLAFSVAKQCKLPPSLKNIYKSIEQDFGIKNTSGDLSCWAKQGVFLLNRVLTVRAKTPMSHQDIGWETFTLNAINYLCENKEYLVFVLWGKQAQALEQIIPDRFDVIKSVHPSPLSAYRGFFDAHCFLQVNECLKRHQLKPIDWRTTDEY